MKHEMQRYEMPEIRVSEISVESGFAASVSEDGLSGGMPGYGDGGSWEW